MAIKYDKIDIAKKSEGLFNATLKIIITDFDEPYEKIVMLEYRPDRPEYFEKNLISHTEEFITEVEEIESVTAIDISKSLEKCEDIVMKSRNDLE